MRGLGWLALACLLSLPASADRALVVGIESYPQLRHARLRGGANDARLMEASLRKLGFATTVLTGSAATREGIEAELRRLAGEVKPDERFVFYFSGYGSGIAAPRLLTSASTDQSEEHDLRTSDLQSLVRAVPCASRAVVLDTCFTGSVTAKGIGPQGATEVSRYYPRGGAAKGIGPATAMTANRADSNRHLSPESEVCYFVACRQSEKALEARFPDGQQGVFSHYLAKALDGPPVDTWGTLQMKVAASVAEETGDRQHPTLSPAFRDRLLFGGQPIEATSLRVAADGWQTLNRDAVDAARLTLSMVPDQVSTQVGDPIEFQVQVGATGHLIVIEHGVSGKVHLIYPLKARLEAAQVTAGQKVRLPLDAARAYSPDQPGTERVRAFLVPSPQQAAALLSALQLTNGSPFQAFVERLKAMRLDMDSMSTSEVVFQAYR